MGRFSKIAPYLFSFVFGFHSIAYANDSSRGVYIWAARDAGSGDPVAECLKITSGQSTQLSVVSKTSCLEKLPVKIAARPGSDTGCAAYTPEGAFITGLASGKCKAPNSGMETCPPSDAGSDSLKTVQDLNEQILLADGGGTSGGGGGDPDGLAAATRTLAAVTKAIQIAEKGVYTEEEKQKLLKAAENLRILVVDYALPVKSKGQVQVGAAYSTWVGGSAVTLLSRTPWNKIENAIDREALLHHELSVLAGIEKTGDYHLTAKYQEFRKNSWKFRQDKTQICTEVRT